MLAKDKKETIVKEFHPHDKDTGSTEVQIALITARISEIAAHLKMHRLDHHSRRGLLSLVGQRRRLLTYLGREDVNRYRAVLTRLGLRR